MFNVIVVDDEVISRVGVINLIDWEKEGFLLADSFENGKDAYEFLHTHAVDLIITDIKMPIMDGIELIERVKTEGLPCEFIMLSAFDDIEYVRKALKLGALDYVLKMELNRIQFLELLSKAKQNLKAKDKKPTAYVPLDKRVMLGIRRDLIKELLYGHNVKKADFLLQLERCSITFPHHTTYVLMFSIEKTAADNGVDDILQMIEEVLSEHAHAYVTWTGYDELSIVFNTEKTLKDQIKLDVERWSRRLRFVMKQYYNQSITVFMSDILNHLEDIPSAYLQVRQLRSSKSYPFNASPVYFWDIANKNDGSDYQSLESCVQIFEAALKQGNIVQIKEAIDLFRCNIAQSVYVEINHVRYFVSSLVIMVNIYLDQRNIEKEKFWGDDGSQYYQLTNLMNQQDIICFIEQLCQKLSAIMAESEGNYLIKKAKDYIKLHYTENISLTQLAEKLDVTGTYLSMLFKKTTGETLMDYVIRLRLEKAQQLLKLTNKHVGEIAFEVGYESEQYFSRIFKQKTNITPTQYRNKQ